MHKSMFKQTAIQQWKTKLASFENARVASEYGYSYAALAERLGVTRQAIANEFNDPNRSMSIKLMELLSPMLGIPLPTPKLPSPTIRSSTRKAIDKYQERQKTQLAAGELTRISGVILDNPRHIEKWIALLNAHNGSTKKTIESLLESN